MSYKRLHSRIKGLQKNASDEIFNAFEAEGQALQTHFIPPINHPHSDYANEIERIKRTDAKLGRTFERLNQHQRHAVFNQSQHAILSAMVGSGKTTVLIAKLFYLHFIENIPFDKMVVLTFTNKAAREIKERITGFLGDANKPMDEQLRYFGTFHAVARQLLQEHEHIDQIAYKPGFMIMDETEKQAFLERVISQENLTIKYENQIAKRWRKFKQNGELLMGNMKMEDDFARLVALAEREKRNINIMDFDDLITLCNQLLASHASINPAWIIVDEFQDCNAEQLQLIEYLRAGGSRVFVVGDQNQSIYAWRGSKERLFQEVQAQWNAVWMELPQNYRSTASILSAAETLLRENDGSLIATRKEGVAMTLIRHFDDQQEAFYLREQMLLLQKEGTTLDNVAILFRTHQQINIVETVFEQAELPFQLVKRNTLHENVAQAFLLRIFKVCINPNDVDACLSVVCDGTFGLLKRSKRLIQSVHKRAANVSALQAVQYYMAQSENPSEGFSLLLTQMASFKPGFLKQADQRAPNLIEFLALVPLLKPTSIHHAKYLEFVNEAWEQVSRYMGDRMWRDALAAFTQAVDQVVLEGSFQINDRIKEQGSGVHLLTIHAAKGLEFDRVYISGINTGIIPLTQNQRGSENLKEEKRLLFVAITRAKNSVEMGWHAQTTLRNAEPEPSYFLNAIPEHLLKRKVAATAESKKVSAETEASELWTEDALVQHKKYGLGKITQVDEKELVCVFDAVGEKTFSRAFAKVLLLPV